MLKIVSRFAKNDLEKLQLTENTNDVALFYEVYHHRNDLTLRELKILRDFYNIQKKHYSFDTIQLYEVESDDNSPQNSKLIDKKYQFRKKSK